MKFPKSLNTIGPWAAAGVPFLALTWLVYLYGLRVLIHDQWDFVPVYDLALSGKLTWADLWAHDDIHRPFFLRLFIAATAALTHGSHEVDLAINVLLALGSFFCFYTAFKKIKADLPAWSFWILLPFASLCVFSLRQFENWVWGVPMVWFLATAASMLGLVLLIRPEFSRKSFCGSACMGIVAVYSISSGFAMWLAAFFLLLFQHYKDNRQKILACLLWCAIFIANACIYFSGGPEAVSTYSDLSAVFRDGKEALHYFFMYLGGIGRYSEAVYLGAGGFLLFVIISISLFFQSTVKRAHYTGLIGIALFSIFFGLFLLAGRLVLGAGQSFTSRYVTTVYPFWIALFTLCCLSLCRLSENENIFSVKSILKRIPLTVCMLAIFAGIAAGSLSETGRMKKYHDHFMEAEPELFRLESQELLARLHGDSDYLRNKIKILKKWKLYSFRDSSRI